MGFPVTRTPIRIWSLTGLVFLGCVPTVMAGIVESDPPNNAVDARWPHQPDDPSIRFGWTGIDLVFDEPIGSIAVSDFLLSEDGGDGVVPVIVSVTQLDATKVRLEWDAPLEPGTWTTVTHVPSGTATRIGFLPGDVDGSGTSMPADVLTLVDAISNNAIPTPAYSADVDHSGAVDDADVAALRDLLEGDASFTPWLSQTISPNGNGGTRGLAPEAEILLVPSHPAPYFPGERISVEFLIRRLTPGETVYLRLIAYAFQETDPQLTLDWSEVLGGDSFWDLSETLSCQSHPPPCGFGHWRFGDPTVDEMVWLLFAGSSENQENQLPLRGDTSPTRTAWIDVILPDTPGTHRLDALNGATTHIDYGARLDFGFDARTTWSAYAGTLTGGHLDFVVEPLPPGVGACCDGFANCTDAVAQDDCQSEGDVYFDQTTCQDVTPACEVTMGACCDRAPGTGGFCRESIRSTCQGQDQVWTYARTCEDVLCAEAKGACCDGVSGTCQTAVLRGDCQAPHATWFQDTACSQVTCELVAGACCSPYSADPLSVVGACVEELTYPDCAGPEQNWFKGQSCSSVLEGGACPAAFQAIPTMSQWGLLIVAIGLLVVAKIYFHCRIESEGRTSC